MTDDYGHNNDDLADYHDSHNDKKSKKLWQLFSPWKIFSCCPPIVWRQVQLRAPFISFAARASTSNKQALFGISKNWTLDIGKWTLYIVHCVCIVCIGHWTWGYWHLLSLAGEKTWTAVSRSWRGQVGKGTQEFALRVIPGSETGWCYHVLNTSPPSRDIHCHHDPQSWGIHSDWRQ